MLLLAVRRLPLSPWARVRQQRSWREPWYDFAKRSRVTPTDHGADAIDLADRLTSYNNFSGRMSLSEYERSNLSTPGQDTREDGHATADTPGTGHSGHTDSGHAHLRKPAQTETHTTDRDPQSLLSGLTVIIINLPTFSHDGRRVYPTHTRNHPAWRGTHRARRPRAHGSAEASPAQHHCTLRARPDALLA